MSDVAPKRASSGQQRAANLPLDLAAHPLTGRELEALVEALLLAASDPVLPDQLARGAGVSVAEIETALAALEGQAHRGWVIQRHQGAVQIATAPRFAGQIRLFLGLERETRLSGPALETLAIIAYQQPVTRSEVEAVRGVDCAGTLSTLHSRGLIEQVGRLQTVGQPIQYGTTPDFLRHFGLRSLADLPALGEVEGRDARVLIESTVAAASMASERETTPTTTDDLDVMPPIALPSVDASAAQEASD